MKRNLSVSRFLFILIIGFAMPRMATAEYCWFWQDCWDEPDDGPGITYDTISVKNGCYKPIHVAMKLYLWDTWVDHVVFPDFLYPGESTEPKRSDSGLWYLYAVSTDWTMEWSGDQWFDLDYEGEAYPFPFMEMNSGTEFVQFTQTLTCD
jgi:hypothetical protein